MAVKQDNTRMTITLSKELDAKLEKLAGLQNISKNAVVINLIEMSIDAQIQVWNSMKDPEFITKMIDLASKMGNEEMKLQIEELGNIMNSNDKEIRENIEKFDKEVNGLKK